MSTEPFSLLTSPWLPVIRRDAATGHRRRDWIRPSDLTDRSGEAPVVALDWRRPDLDAAAREFLIGLLATACPPLDDEDWRERWWEPPTPDELTAAFAPYAEAFVLDGNGPRFMQDREELAGAPVGVSGLLIDNPGQKTVEDNLDLFAKRGRTPALSRAGAAIALYALQSFAPSGGAGHRTSLRGGGPLTTLALPGDSAAPLWHTLWLSVPPYDAPAAGDLARVFPWLAPTRTSEDGKAATAPPDIDADGRQCF
jgi:CRISPR system Cascade subunit CasA